jgi:hypothetical protein
MSTIEDGALIAEYLRVVSVVQENNSYHKFPLSWSAQVVEQAATIAP